jgi:hypothetical protein
MLILTIPISPSVAALNQLVVCLSLFVGQDVHDLAANCVTQSIELWPHFLPQLTHIHLAPCENSVDHLALRRRES